MIAASIVVVAAQNVLWPDRYGGPRQWLVAFAFGLFHGLGFASGLLEVMDGFRSADAALAITAFSAGVEAGHQVVVLPTFVGLALLRPVRYGNSGRDRAVRVSVVREPGEEGGVRG